MRACPAKKGDCLEFFAEIDLLCALSTCPGGDLSVRCAAGGAGKWEADRLADRLSESRQPANSGYP